MCYSDIILLYYEITTAVSRKMFVKDENTNTCFYTKVNVVSRPFNRLHCGKRRTKQL